MTASEVESGWGAWVARLTSEFANLAEGGWLTFTVPAADADTFVQARVLEGVFALECIVDTQFEGVSDLSSAQQEALNRLGWHSEGDGPDLDRTFPADESGAAAELVAATFREVLGTDSPDQVDIRRPT